MQRNKLFLLLALLMTAATGAWADETPLVTINASSEFTSGSKTFDDKVTVTYSSSVYYDSSFGWYAIGSSKASLLTVAGINGYTITSCKFYTANGTANTGYTVEGESPSVYLAGAGVYIDDSKSLKIGEPGLTKIEVYGTAPTAPTTYSVKMKSGTVDAGNWTIASGEKSAKGDEADGLTGLSEKDAVTLTYTGRLKVKGVKATSDAEPASVPDGAISGVFSVSATKKVYFSKGNLRYASSKWSFFDNQYDYYESHSADAWDKFGWSTSTTTYGMNTSASSSDYSGDFVDWGATMGTGWFTLSSDEWTYLFNTRTVNGGTGSGKSYTLGQSVNGTLGFVIYPDNYTGAVYSGSDWATFESAGCVFLPAAGLRSGSSVYSRGTDGFYWSASPYDTGSAYSVYFSSGNLSPASYDGRSNACSVRLVREVATSDEEQAAGNSVDLSTLTADYEAQNGDVLTGTLGNYKITIADGATVTLSGAVINGTSNDSYTWAGLTLAGDGTIILSGENSVKGFYEDYPGIFVPKNKTLTIQGDGSLTASSNGYGAGIGGGWNIACGNITIEGGTVTATGGNMAAGIGGGRNTSCGDISITGGTVTATGGNVAAGIGCGYNTSCGNITIANTVTKVTATKADNATNSIGAGLGGSCGTVTIGGTVYPDGITESPYTYQPSAAPAAPALNITSPSVGQIIGSDGKNYAYGSLPTGVTAVAMIAKVSGTSGLAIALADEEGTMNYDTAVTTAAAHTPTFTGVTWRLPTQNEWKQMFAANGDEYNYSGLNTAIKAAGGTALQGDAYYWSSEEDGDYVYAVFLDVDDVTWDSYKKDKAYRVRACLAF